MRERSAADDSRLTPSSHLSVLPMLIIGSLVTCPGLYYSTIAFLAWRGARGYSLDLIPDV